MEIDRELVLRKLNLAFPDPEERRQALEILDTYGRTKYEPVVVGVQLAVIRLCEGKLDRVRALVSQAREDFRDVLYLAQAPETMARVMGSARARAAGAKPAEEKNLDRTAMVVRDQRGWLDWLRS